VSLLVAPTFDILLLPPKALVVFSPLSREPFTHLLVLLVALRHSSLVEKLVRGGKLPEVSGPLPDGLHGIGMIPDDLSLDPQKLVVNLLLVGSVGEVPVRLPHPEDHRQEDNLLHSSKLHGAEKKSEH
jgi:hypothetical protein